ncbi:AMP-binding protein [Kocuria sp. LUK]|uniref:AMP-binding protein n=1 Tax=Kocuria sp. LUK TaxID=2897828 RepID=UPI001E2FAA82|nr:AMP-binding protein [Kocuria sp. LUK]MCD1146361.1 AMP-binding protein [Kocuria sp. LUK]
MLANHEPLSPLRFLQRSAEVFPDREAVVHGTRRWTYRRFAAEAQRLARALGPHLEPGGRVAVVAPNVPEMLLAHYAVPLAGGVLVPLNPRLSGRELGYVLGHSEARVVLADTEVVATVARVARQLEPAPVVVEVNDPTTGAPPAAPEGAVALERFLEAGPDGPDLPWRVADENTPITLNYTSGTTGPPKGVLYSHRGAYLNALGEVFHNGFDGATRYLWTLPMFHCNGWCTTWAVTAAGGRHVCLRAVRAEAVWEAFDTEGITHLCGAPVVCSTIVDAEQAHPLDRPLRITTAGAPPAPSVIQRLEEHGMSVVHVYGLTEVYGPHTICEPQDEWAQLPPAERARTMARQGVGMLQAESARVVDERMRDVPADGETLGEVVLRGNNVMLGYFKDEQATAEAFRGGWYHTGDLGVMHPDGYLQLKDRAKDIIISGGENISSIEVEQALASHPDVLDVAVVGVPDEKWGERPVAWVVRTGGSSATAEELRAHAAERLARFKVPDSIRFPEQLPRTATGKVRKNELRGG